VANYLHNPVGIEADVAMNRIINEIFIMRINIWISILVLSFSSSAFADKFKVGERVQYFGNKRNSSMYGRVTAVNTINGQETLTVKLDGLHSEIQALSETFQLVESPFEYADSSSGASGIEKNLISSLEKVTDASHMVNVTNECVKGSSFHRPETVQRVVDNSFTSQLNGQKKWNVNGVGKHFYNLMGLEDDKVIHEIVSREGSDKDIYLIDVGSGEGAWGRQVVEFLKNEFSESKKNFHIISMTGDRELEPKIEKDGNITYYQFDQFKVEDIAQELQKRGLNLTNKVDFIVSRWTLRHVVDPLGTVDQMYSLLKPGKGLLMANGFFIGDETGELHTTTSDDKWKILASGNAKSLFREGIGHDLGDFLLIRQDDRSLGLGVEYSGNVMNLSAHHDCGSQSATCFKSLDQFNSKPDRIIDTSNNGKYYGKAGSELLVQDLLKRGLLSSETHKMPEVSNPDQAQLKIEELTQVLEELKNSKMNEKMRNTVAREIERQISSIKASFNL
jgi:hypothetical protein